MVEAPYISNSRYIYSFKIHGKNCDLLLECPQTTDNIMNI